MQQWDVIVIGAGAAGLFCAIEAAKRGRKTLVLDNGKRIGRKIIMSGGGRCNFTNMYASPANFLSQNPHFCKSALSRYTQWDFIALVQQYGIAYHEKTLGQLFCDNSAKDIVEMLQQECDKAGVQIGLQQDIQQVSFVDGQYQLTTAQGVRQCHSLVIASGGLSLPNLGATAFGFQLAEQFGLKVLPVRAGLVPLTWQPSDKAVFEEISGVALPVTAEANDTQFPEDMLFTHRGLSGPAILQISNYWQPGDELRVNLAAGQDVTAFLTEQQQQHPAQELKTSLARLIPKRLVDKLLELQLFQNQPLKALNAKSIARLDELLTQYVFKPNGTEGYRTAEVTLGGVDTNELSSKTMEAKKQPGLYFIGEVVDVTGWLGGYNFQWAWSSGWVAGQYC
ncbi:MULTISPECIES: NAD(P)/FAD-dependent oxidoreductase [Gammaproteobacteria]|uniref:NAD(P)/FAD-dependent oxidoreductase n=1 Tax=Gammaproteobacteria TaxID=1236 RepID=UPI001E356F4E|nr:MULTISPECIES: NAD(P)/FAD-dependent oxidoreductase [Gammaproteobacteria]MCC5450693.1 NAD(P)/FAD-dependent oxidoreductase [Rheinheimera sp. UJ51]MDP5187077.1 NAD(P)/FAD-dependent oxidoreductase [Alishewanella sp.]MDP5458961.1 NAD(P)/FAD-dependent oxidoreductase [Alishewanella sp. SMS8]